MDKTRLPIALCLFSLRVIYRMVKHAESSIPTPITPTFVFDSQLCKAASEGNIKGIRILLADADDREKLVNSSDKHSQYPLLYASREGHDDIVALLLKNGANVDVGETYTPLMCAAIKGNTTTFKLLLDHGANPNFIYDQYTSLIIAVTRGDTAMVKLLLAQPNIDINIGNIDGKTVLDKAIELGKSEIVQLLQDFQEGKKPPPQEAKPLIEPSPTP